MYSICTAIPDTVPEIVIAPIETGLVQSLVTDKNQQNCCLHAVYVLLHIFIQLNQSECELHNVKMFLK